ncbi:peroxiredoxin-like family protein [Chryseobacterium sp. EO14]|uniref:peroxiredoxin-like family protein n=1 Tax=Chryseobacterium sp. EO14 TaxID=2950551 RepID=UPI00210C9A6B|nr:peroxiredoxin-like family protein [Chryseobacterium sp. EO14]MCQ4140622.1 AhpC/TSA family protein [Chryseobacterium sp. EO14]
MNELAKQIEKFNNELATQVPQEILEAFGKSIEDLKTKNIEEKSIKLNEMMPSFSLPNAKNEIIHSKEILKSGKMIIAFYRGSWCPYCNLELKALQDNSSKINDKKASLVAISPQSPDNSLTIIEKHSLTFEVLTDKDNTFAKQLGIAFELQDFVLPYYKALGIDLTNYNKNIDNSLPIPAVFVVNEDGKIIYKFADANYMNRIDIDELLNTL